MILKLRITNCNFQIYILYLYPKTVFIQASSAGADESLHFATECGISSGSTLFTALQSRMGESATYDLQQTTF